MVYPSSLFKIILAEDVGDVNFNHQSIEIPKSRLIGRNLTGSRWKRRYAKST